MPANEPGLFFGHGHMQMLGLKALPARNPLDQMLQRYRKLCFLYAECTAFICVLYFVAQKAYIAATRDFRFEPQNNHWRKSNDIAANRRGKTAGLGCAEGVGIRYSVEPSCARLSAPARIYRQPFGHHGSRGVATKRDDLDG